jgi:sugar (pentulose or hexulose) kinase
MAYLAGIDLGSTSLKAVIYDLDGHALGHASRPTKVVHPYLEHPDWAIWEPAQIWGGVCESLREATSQVRNPADIKAVAVTGMGMDGVPIAATGAGSTRSSVGTVRARCRSNSGG